MEWVLHETKQKPLDSPSSSSDTHGFSLNDSSATLLIAIIVLSGIFFISSLFHLIVRFLLCSRFRNSDELEDDLTALQGQLQQLFNLHDSGVNQAFIDTLPVFNYKSILGIEAPFDCAVCLCEFEAEDKLRLLPKCSHAFHVNCIDTWLLSHSSCPLCRANLVADLSLNRNCVSVMVLESENGSSRELVCDSFAGSRHENGVDDDGSGVAASSAEGEIEVEAEESDKTVLTSLEKFVQIKLGKYKAIDSGVVETGAEARRCFSMGSFAYVIDDNLNSSLRVPIKLTKKSSISRGSLSAIESVKRASSLRFSLHRNCGGREFNGIESFRALEEAEKNKDMNGDEKENLSAVESTRRAFSFRFSIHRNPGTGTTGKNCDEEMRKCSNSWDCEEEAPSFGRRTMFWLIGKNKDVHDSSCSSNV